MGMQLNEDSEYSELSENSELSDNLENSGPYRPVQNNNITVPLQLVMGGVLLGKKFFIFL